MPAARLLTAHTTNCMYNTVHARSMHAAEAPARIAQCTANAAVLLFRTARPHKAHRIRLCNGQEGIDSAQKCCKGLALMYHWRVTPLRMVAQVHDSKCGAVHDATTSELLLRLLLLLLLCFLLLLVLLWSCQHCVSCCCMMRAQ
jgi:hypothetical protein